MQSKSKEIKVIKWLVIGLFFYFCMIPFMKVFIGTLIVDL